MDIVNWALMMVKVLTLGKEDEESGVEYKSSEDLAKEFGLDIKDKLVDDVRDAYYQSRKKD